MTTTVLRVKRRLDEEPAEALVVHSKRFKKDEDLTPSVFVFQGTVKEKDESDQCIKVNFRNKKVFTKDAKTISKIKEKLKESKQVSENRMKIIDCSRGIISNSEGVNDSKQQIDNLDADYSLIDLHHLNETTPKDKDNEPKYAYDLYFPQENNLCIDDMEDVAGIHTISSKLLFVDDLVTSSDDEDSNNENNIGNEYPDTDDSINEEDMMRAVRNMNIEDDLSSEDDEEMMGYNNHGVKQSDIDRYGPAYGRYKAKILKLNEGPEKHPELIHYEISDLRTSDDSDDGICYPKYDD